MTEFFSMGGYAAYVWPSYLLALLVLLTNILQPLFHRRRLLADIRRKIRRSRTPT